MMKQQLKKLISREIRSLEIDAAAVKKMVGVYEKQCDKVDTSDSSKYMFSQLNLNRNELRKVNHKLNNLRIVQKKVKSTVTYGTRTGIYEF